MSLFRCFILAFSMVFAGAEALFRYREGALQWLVLVLYLIWFAVLLVTTARLLCRGRRPSLNSAVLAIWLVAAPFAGAQCGIIIRDAVFRSRLTEYETAVHNIQSGIVPIAVPRLAYHISQTPGHQEVFFFWGSGFPVKHTAFVYSQNDPNLDKRFAQAWHHARPLAPNWYVTND
jgi:hypothetical protein